jgi:hypothetical protein
MSFNNIVVFFNSCVNFLNVIHFKMDRLEHSWVMTCVIKSPAKKRTSFNFGILSWNGQPNYASSNIATHHNLSNFMHLPLG